ncbi:hypothetical protein D3C85_794960 [compost metagenome]
MPKNPQQQDPADLLPPEVRECSSDHIDLTGARVISTLALLEALQQAEQRGYERAIHDIVAASIPDPKPVFHGHGRYQVKE